VRAFLVEVARGAAIELFHLLTFQGCSRWTWAWRVCCWLDGCGYVPARDES